MNPEFLAMLYIKNSVITNLEPNFQVEDKLQYYLCRVRQCKTHRAMQNSLYCIRLSVLAVKSFISG
jgi:hypothetical protein